MPPRIVLDTNVLYAGLRSSLGASHEIMRGIRSKSVVPVISPPVILEYEEVLKREAPSLDLTVVEIDSVLDALCLLSEQHVPVGRWSPILLDPDDEAFVHLAVSARVDWLITHNARHFAPGESHGIKVLAPRAFLGIITI